MTETFTQKEHEAMRILDLLYKKGETKECANWILRCLGLLDSAQSAVVKLKY